MHFVRSYRQTITNVGRVLCLIPDLSQSPPDLPILSPARVLYPANPQEARHFFHLPM